MTDSLIVAMAALAITAMLCGAALRGFTAWLELRRAELASFARPRAPDSDIGLRIELAAVRERLKRLEEIASGVEL